MVKKRKSIAASLAEIEQRVDADELLDADTKATIKAKAREHVRKKRQEKAEDEYLQAAIAAEERAHNPLEQYEDVLIDLAPYAPFISLDGEMFFHGLIYSVRYAVARTMYDTMARTWEHQNEIDGKRRRGDMIMKPRHAHLSRGMEGMSTTSLNRM